MISLTLLNTFSLFRVFFAGVRRGLLDKIQGLMASQPATTMVHFELASFAEQECLQDVLETVVFQSDSLGVYSCAVSCMSRE